MDVPQEPTAADLAAIEAEWPLIAAEMDLVGAEIALLTADPAPTPLDWRRVRRAEHRALRAFVAFYGRHPESPLAAAA